MVDGRKEGRVGGWTHGSKDENRRIHEQRMERTGGKPGGSMDRRDGEREDERMKEWKEIWVK